MSGSPATLCVRLASDVKSRASRPSSALISRRSSALEPDLALAFSDLQADVVRDLVKASVAVHAFNHRDVAEIYGMIRTVGALVGASAKAAALVEELAAGVERIRELELLCPADLACTSRSGTSP